ncbi:MAG TPA: hypothetical protein VJ373_05710, partial [Desulfatiglandales bacterium]|nr:hypothetical protein [Desulfatiglandales bacterium]
MTNVSLIIIVITAVVIIIGYLILRFIINFYRNPVLEINLTPVEDAKWSDRKKVADLTDWFLRNGFESAGLYECWEMPGVIISGFILHSEQIMGVIYEHPIGGIYVDICVEYTDGGSLTVSNAPIGHTMDHMPQQTKLYCRDAAVDELYGYFRNEIKDSDRKTIRKEEFASNFEAAYRKEMKWRMDRGGPTSSEVMRIAQKMGETVDSERLQGAMQEIQDRWTREEKKLGRMKKRAVEAVLPVNFQQPGLFRQAMEQKSSPIPMLNIPALPVYFVLVSAIACWCYYGYQYHKVHFTISLNSLIIFLGVFLVLFIILMWFRGYHRFVRICPVLKRVADLRPGAFLFISGTSPALFYAREQWIGKVHFQEGSEDQDTFTRVDAVTRHSSGLVLISRKGLLTKIIGWSDKDVIQLPESDFSRKFTVSGTDSEFAGRLISSGFPEAVMRLEDIGKPSVEIEHNTVTVKIDSDLSSPRK